MTFWDWLNKQEGFNLLAVFVICVWIVTGSINCVMVLHHEMKMKEIEAQAEISDR